MGPETISLEVDNRKKGDIVQEEGYRKGPFLRKCLIFFFSSRVNCNIEKMFVWFFKFIPSASAEIIGRDIGNKISNCKMISLLAAVIQGKDLFWSQKQEDISIASNSAALLIS